MKQKMNFRNSIILWAVIITFIPLLLSYIVFISLKINDVNKDVRNSLKEVGYSISKSEFVKSKLYVKENDGSIQEYTKGFIKNFKDVDIIVVGDMNGIKYSHLDESQIGQVYVNEDDKKVLDDGSSYYSQMTGSMGTTFRWLEPIFYEGRQIGFVMVGKYNSDIYGMISRVTVTYFMLFAFAIIISIIGSIIFADRIKKSILNMEPIEIAALYKEKNIIIDSVKDGIIALNSKKDIIEVSKSCYVLFENFIAEEVLEKLKQYIEYREEVEMKEFIVCDKKVFVTIRHIALENDCLRSIITLTDKKPINKIAKEITGIDEVVKNLRASVHEFKNNLHVILGLIQIKAYDEAKDYILKIQKLQENTTNKFSDIKDAYIRALLIGRDSVARERKVDFSLSDESFLYEEHGIIDSYDIVTILGNLIENAFESCALCVDTNKKVEVSLYEDEFVIEIAVRDNGKPIDSFLKDKIFNEGVSSKGENRGTGLFLVKNRVELYNGRINIEENENEKIFFITILKGE